MILGTRTTLRPVVWSEVDNNGRLKRREPSISSDDNDGDCYSSSRKKTRISSHSAVYYPPRLSPSEILWRDRYNFLSQRGYQLRPRYQPNWTPTMLGSGSHHVTGEDHIMQILPRVLDTIRRQDGLVVCIKMIKEPSKARQITISEFFSSRRMTNDTRNHVVPLYDRFVDAYATNIQFMVMPVLRRFDNPEFVAPCEVIDFVSQALEGLAFLHENFVAHHNLIAEHIMMDAKSIIPTGWHFVSHFCEPDGITKISPLERRNYPVRYYFVGFGSAYHLPPPKQPLVRDIGGGDDDVPELAKGKSYDPFKLDIYTLGNVFKKELYEKYHGLDFIPKLLAQMHMQDFSQRPNAAKILSEWYGIRRNLDEEEMENTRLHLRKGIKKLVCHEYPVEESSPSGSLRSTKSGSTRSDKRDISSILNKC